MAGIFKENCSLGHSSAVIYRQNNVQQGDPGIILSKDLLALFGLHHFLSRI